MRAGLLLPLVILLLSACGGGGFEVPALTDESTCEEAEEVVTIAVEEAQAYLGIDKDEPALADQIIFALSAVEERPECFDSDRINQARGLRTSLNAGL